MVDQKLVNYVSSGLKSGKTAQQMETELKNQGWRENDIRDAIRIAQMESGSLAKSGNGPKLSHKHVYIIGVIIAVAILAVAAFYVMSVMPDDDGDDLPDRCGNGICNFGETPENCPEDCGEPPGDNPPPSGPVIVSLSPAIRNIGIGQEFTLDVTLSDGNEIYGFQFEAEYDPSILEFVGSEEGNFLNKNGADSTFCLDEKASGGHVKNIACTRLGQGSASGDGIIMKLMFKALSEGTSAIELGNVRILNSVPEQVKSTVQDGEVIVS